MRVKVKQTYRDKKTRKIVYAGSILEMGEERFHEINSVNGGRNGTLVEREGEDGQQEVTNESEGEETENGDAEENGQSENIDLHSLKYSDLQKLAKKNGVLAKGSKEELIESIYQAMEKEEE